MASNTNNFEQIYLIHRWDPDSPNQSGLKSNGNEGGF